MKTITDLSNKWWYRLVKVIYISLFLLISAGLISIYFGEAGSYQDDYLVVCNYGNKNTFLAYKEKEIYISSYYDYSNGLKDLTETARNELQRACEISEVDLNALFKSIRDGTDHKALFDLKEVKVPVATYWSATLWSLFSILITLVIFEVIKRAFYYIVLGSIKPNK